MFYMKNIIFWRSMIFKIYDAEKLDLHSFELLTSDR